MSDLASAPIRLAAAGDSILVDDGLWARFAVEGRGDRYVLPDRFNQAVGGATTQTVLERLDAVTALSPDIVVLHVGTNDLIANNEPPRAIYERIVAACARWLDGGIGYVIVLCVLPRRDIFWQSCPFRHADRRGLNGMLRRMPRDPVLAVYRDRIGIVDLEASFDPLVNTKDGLHPSLTGAQKLGRAVGQQLDRIDGTARTGRLRALGATLERAARLGLSRLRGHNRY